MTVKELRDILDKCEDEAEVRIIGCNTVPYIGIGNSIVDVVVVANLTFKLNEVFISMNED